MEFTQYYKQLNNEQRLAVDTIEGPVMVIAGPGTGKTQILTLRIANILKKTDIDAEAILAVTFTEAGVIAMRKRLAEIIGSQAYEVSITTFHGFAQSIIQKFPEAFPRIIGSVNITEADQVRIMEEILEETKGLKILRPYGDRLHYLRDALSAIQTLKREGISGEDFEVIVEKASKAFTSIDDLYHEKGAHKGKMKGEYKDAEKQIEKNRELGIIYGAYQAKLTEEKLYDFDDMIMETLGAMRSDADLLLQLQEKYQYVLVDEHQDTNNAQNRILELLMSYHDNPNLFIVGDEKQAIFRFQGASLENFHYFKNKFPEAKLITLTENYRSTQSILDVVATKLKAMAGREERTIKIIEAPTSDTELYIIAKKILELPGPRENIAVLVRDNRDVFPLARMLEKLEIPHHIESDLDLLSDPDVRKLVLLFKAINTFGDPISLIPVLYLDIWNVEPLEVHKFVSEKLSLKSAFPEIYKKLSSWTTMAHNKTLLELFDTVVNESGLLKVILARTDSVEALEKLGVFLDQIRKLLEVKPDATLADFMDRLERMDRHRLSIKGALAGSHPGKVRLMTTHRSKGLEFDYVFVINAFSGHWGNRRHIDKLKLLPAVYGVAEAQDNDERNLFYVALTRAKKELFISYAKLSLDQRELLPSQLISELKPELLEYIDVAPYEEDFVKHREIIFGAPSSDGVRPDIQNIDFVRELFKKRGFAVTHLNNYLECPWKYFFVNLVRVPQAPEAPQMYGIAIHGALSDLLNQEERSKTYLITQFKKYLATQPLGKIEREDFEERGVEALGVYYDEYHATWTRPVLTEFKIKGIELTPDILLTGAIDKLEILDGNGVIVTDYKTGKPKSRNEIMGNTRTADASYYRQLVFYNLLLNRYKDGFYKMKYGELDFVEHAKKEKFEITAEDIVALEQQIRMVADEILNLKFWNKKCDDPDCQWCELREIK